MFNFSKKTKNSFLDGKKIGITCCNFWNNNFILFFVIFSFLMMFLGSYVWYKNIYTENWNDEKKNNYKKTENEEVSFKEQLFKSVIGNFEARKEKYYYLPENRRDIFSDYLKNGISEENNIEGDKENSSDSNFSNNIPIQVQNR